jgi:hypothetical protein
VKLNWSQILGAVSLALVTGATQFSVGGPNGYVVTAHLSGGSPVHFTPAALLQAAVMVVQGGTGTIQSGVVVVTVAKAAA